jgi:hypothetical protein
MEAEIRIDYLIQVPEKNMLLSVVFFLFFVRKLESYLHITVISEYCLISF